MENIIALFFLIVPVLGNIIALTIIVFIAIGIAKGQKRRKEQKEIQDFNSYQNYIYPPSRFPRFIHMSKDGYKAVAIMLFVVITIFNIIILLTHDKGYIPILAVIDIICLCVIIYCLYCYKNKEMPFIKLTKDSISFEDTTIKYNEIKSILHVSERRGRGKKSSTYHFFEIRSMNQVLKLQIIDFLPEEWAEIINCCIYINPSIIIDRVAMEILINKQFSNLV